MTLALASGGQGWRPLDDAHRFQRDHGLRPVDDARRKRMVGGPAAPQGWNRSREARLTPSQPLRRGEQGLCRHSACRALAPLRLRPAKHASRPHCPCESPSKGRAVMPRAAPRSGAAPAHPPPMLAPLPSTRGAALTGPHHALFLTTRRTGFKPAVSPTSSRQTIRPLLAHYVGWSNLFGQLWATSPLAFLVLTCPLPPRIDFF